MDLTINRIEAVRGGSASVFASGAPGGIINFTSKTGQNELEGVTKLTVGDYGLFRTDFNVGGAIVEDKLFYNVGGFFEADLEDGIHPVANAVGGVFEFDLTDNISVKNAFKSTTIDLDYNAIFAAHWMGDVSTQDQTAANFGVPTGDATFTYDDDGSTLAAGIELKRADYWNIKKQMRNAVNNLSFNFDLNELKLLLFQLEIRSKLELD